MPRDVDGPSLSVVIPATDDPPTVERCVAAVAASTEPPDEVMVVSAPKGAGPAEARNLGALRAAGDVVVFVDSDVIVHPDALARIRAVLAADPELEAVFGAYDASPEAPGTVSAFRNLLSHHVHMQSEGPCISFWAGLGAIRRDALIRSGGFDAKLYPRPMIEDVELGYRMTEAGMRIELDPAIRGTHLKHWTLRRMIHSDFARRGVPWTILVLERRRAHRSKRGVPWTVLMIERRLARQLLNLGVRHWLSALVAAAWAASSARRKPVPIVAAVGVFTLLNRDFYTLIWRRRGPRAAMAGVVLHAVHHLTGAVAAVAGVAVHLRGRRGPDLVTAPPPAEPGIGSANGEHHSHREPHSAPTRA